MRTKQLTFIASASGLSADGIDDRGRNMAYIIPTAFGFFGQVSWQIGSRGSRVFRTRAFAAQTIEQVKDGINDLYRTFEASKGATQ